MKQTLRNLFVLAIFFLVSSCFGQTKYACFERFFNQGKVAYDSLKMREAILKFDAALQCPGVTDANRDTILQWKLRIDEQLREFFKKRDAVNLERIRAQHNAVDEKISAAESATINREYMLSLALLSEAKKIAENIGKDKNIEMKLMIIKNQIQYNDSLSKVKKVYSVLLLQSDSILKQGKDFFRAYEKLHEALHLNYDMVSAKNKMARLKGDLSNCLSVHCFLRYNKSNVYFQYAMIENISGQSGETKKYLKKGLKAGKMKYLPPSDLYPEKIRTHAESYIKTYYRGLFDVYFDQTSLGILKFNTGGTLLTTNAGVTPLRVKDLTVDDDVSISEYIALNDAGARFSNALVLRGGFFAGKTLKTGPEISIIPHNFDFELTALDSTKVQIGNTSIIKRNIYLSGHYKSLLHLSIHTTWNIILLRKKSLRSIPIIELSPIFGFGFRFATFTTVTQDDISTIDNYSFLNYFYNKKISTVPVTKAALYLNFKLFRRFFISMGYRVDMDLKPAKFVLPTAEAYAQSEPEIQEIHTPFEITFQNKQVMKGMSVRFLFRL